MILRIVVVIAICFTGCTITVTPIKKTVKPKPKSQHVSKHKTKSKPVSVPSSPTIVDSEWLIEYRKLEEEHGYTIRDDAKVESVGGGKYRVTPTMLKHFKDLSQVPVSE